MVKHILDDLLNATSALCLLSGNTGKVYFGIGHACAVAEWLSKNSFVILGFEGFKSDGYSIVPLVDNIADFSTISGSSNERVQKSFIATTTVLLQWASAVEFVEFVIEEVTE